MEEIVLIKENLDIWNNFFEYFFQKLDKEIKDENIKRVLYFYKKLSSLLSESLDLLNEEKYELFLDKLRAQIEFIQYLKFICCSSEKEEIFLRSMIYEFIYEINIYKYEKNLKKYHDSYFEKESENEEFDKFMKEKIEKINNLYKAICRNNFFPQTELYTRINKKGIKKELLEKDILKIKELYWYSFCSNCKNMNELFLQLTYYYDKYDGDNFIDITLEEKVQKIVEKFNESSDVARTKNKGKIISIEGKTLGSIIEELKDKVRNPRFNKENSIEKKQIILEIKELKKIKIGASFKNLIYEMLSYKIHASDILNNNFKLNNDLLIYYESIFTLELYALVKQFFNVFYDSKTAKQKKIMFYYIKVEKDLMDKKKKYLEEYDIEELKLKIEKYKLNIKTTEKFWQEYKELQKIFKIIE